MWGTDRCCIFHASGYADSLAKPAQCTQDIDFEHLELLKFVQNEMASYEYYHDDGYSKDYENPEHLSLLFSTTEE